MKYLSKKQIPSSQMVGNICKVYQMATVSVEGEEDPAIRCIGSPLNTNLRSHANSTSPSYPNHKSKYIQTTTDNNQTTQQSLSVSKVNH